MQKKFDISGIPFARRAENLFSEICKRPITCCLRLCNVLLNLNDETGKDKKMAAKPEVKAKPTLPSFGKA